MKTVWTDEEDKILVETILRNVSKGSTAQKAFEEVAAKLKKKKSICSCRWYKFLKPKFLSELHLARKQRYELKYKNS
ncbi:hypothetical protein NCCP28_30080 [Niallia sp. NCCP-28]|nr:hypothetical protein NCCP28_30080 [Niallia sp. NCCP-28]